MSRQDMRSIGRGWSNNAQLFWIVPAPVDRPIRNWPNLSLLFNAPAAGTYEIVLHYTKAPDYGTFRLFIDRQSSADIDGYAPTVVPEGRSLGQHKLAAGSHQFLLTVSGKARASRGFSVGLDRIELQPVDNGTFGATRNPNRGGSQGVGSQGPRPQLVAAELTFANVDSISQQWNVKAGTERPFDRTNTYAHFVWQSAAGAQ